jgi:hypothetical protein
MYCPNCGNKVKEGEMFCGSCGALAYNGTAYHNNTVVQEPVSNTTYIKPRRIYGHLKLVVVMGIIWTIVSLFLAIVIKSDFDDVFSPFLPFMILSGLCALTTVVLVGLKKMYIVALIACIMGSVLALPLVLIPGIVGLYAARQLYLSKDQFN